MKLVFTPDWFLGKDVLIEGFSFVVLFVFSILSIKNYKLSKKKNFLYLGVGFLLIAVAQLAIIVTKLVLYYDIPVTQQIGQAIITYNVVNSVDIFYYIGFFFHRLFTLTGFYIIYRIYRKKTPLDVILVFYFIVLSVLFSQSIYYIFHITTFLFIGLIIRDYYKICLKNKSGNTKILILSFGLLALSHLIYVMSKMSVLYVTANLIELLSYIILLILMVRILYGKKKKPNGYNC